MRKFCILFIGVILLASCDPNRVFDSYDSIEKAGWHKDSLVNFNLPVLDSAQNYHLYFNIRNTNDYQYSNLYLISKLSYPNGKQKVDTLEYEMAKPDGTWLGTGITSMKESKLWYKENFKFQENGNYSVSIQQAMRTNGNAHGIVYLKGITDIGFRVEAAETP